MGYKWTSGTTTLEEYHKGADHSPKYGRRIAQIKIIDATLPTTTVTATQTTTATVTVTNTTAAPATTVVTTAGPTVTNTTTAAATGGGSVARDGVASSAKELLSSTVWIVTSVGAFLQCA